MEKKNKIVDDLAEKLLDGSIEGNSKFMLEIYENHSQLLLNENKMSCILKQHKVSINKINLAQKSNNISILDYLLKKQDVALIGMFIEKKKNKKIFIENLKEPLVLYSLLHKLNLCYSGIKKREEVFNNIIEIESALLKEKKNKKTSITDFLEVILKEKSMNLLETSFSDKKLFNLEFILNNIPNKNFKETTNIKGKSIPNDLLLITSLTMTGLLAPKRNIEANSLKIIEMLNQEISVDLIKKILSLNIVGLESVFNKEITIKPEKLINLANASICLIDLNKENHDFMKSKEVNDCLTILGHKKLLSYFYEKGGSNSINVEEFDVVRRELLENRMNHILNDNKICD